MTKLKAFPKPVAAFFFLIGLTSALSFRAIIIAQRTNPSSVRVLWYLAVITNLIFFLFRYYISLRRKRAIHSSSLKEKLVQNQPLEQQERNALIYLLTSIDRSHENLNYLSIFILSALAIIIDILMSMH